MRLVHENCPVGYPWSDSTADIYMADYRGLPVYFVERGEYFDRRHYYCTHKGDYFDNGERFIFFCRAALCAIRHLGMGTRIVHCQDWHTGLAVAYLAFWRRSDPFWSGIRTIMSIHNLAYQGRFSYRLFEASGLPVEAWNIALTAIRATPVSMGAYLAWRTTAVGLFTIVVVTVTHPIAGLSSSGGQ